MSKQQRKQKDKAGLKPYKQKLVYAFAAMGYDGFKYFKFYESLTNIKGKLKAKDFLPFIQPLLQHAKRHFDSKDFILWMDGDPAHTAKKTSDWIKEEG